MALCCTSFCLPCLLQFFCCQRFPFCSNSSFHCLFCCLRCLGTHQRSILFPLGNVGFRFVRCGNQLASRMVLVCAFALSKSLRILVEQPQHSSLELHPRFAELWEWTLWFRSAFWGGAYALGATEQATASPKRHWIWSNDRTLLHRVSIAAGRLNAEQLQQLQNKPLTTRKRDATGKVVWTGEREAMRQSQCFGGRYSFFNML